MKRYLLIVVLNIGLFLLLQFGVVLAVFQLGYASSDKHLEEQLKVYLLFSFVHISLLYAIPYFRKSLSAAELLFVSLIVIVSWILTWSYVT